MYILQESKDRGHLCNDSNGNAGGCVVSRNSISLAFLEIECDDECTQHGKTGEERISQISRLQRTVVRVTNDNELHRHRSAWPKLRDPGLETAVDGIIKGIEEKAWA